MTVDYLRIVQLSKQGVSWNRISQACSCKWETVQRTIIRCVEVWGSIDSVPDGTTSADIDALINRRTSIDDGYLQPDCDDILEKCRKGEKRNTLWSKYALKAEEEGLKAYKLSRFNEIVSGYARMHNIIVSMHRFPGQECQIDWVGDKATIIDYDTKKPVQLHLFVKRRYVFSVKSAGNVSRRVRHRAFRAERNNLVKPYFDRRMAYRVKHRDTGYRVNALFRGF